MSSALSFFEKIRTCWDKKNTLLCVGLDIDITKIPEHLRTQHLKTSDLIVTFNKRIIDATHEYVCCYKPQSAFYEQYGQEGFIALQKTIQYIHQAYPSIPVLLDAKRGDIGSTAEAYAKAIFEVMEADAVTVNPYLGKDSVMPFLTYKNKGVFILAKTSNPGSAEFQNSIVAGMPLYLTIAQSVVNNWNIEGNCGLVVGATYPEELKKVRDVVGDMPLLIPGIGVQGGNIDKTVNAGKDLKGMGMIISSSRAIMYAANDEKFAFAAGKEAKRTRDEINSYRHND